MPTLPGKESFEGEIVHSHNYRTPELYKDQVVVLLGANASGQDIALEISAFAKKVGLMSGSSSGYQDSSGL